MSDSSPRDPAPQRLASLDALRGFDMFWIIGGAALLSRIAARVGWPPLTAAADFMGEHVEWEGFRFHDLIFPLFLFIIGVAMPFSLGRRVEQGASRRDLLIRVARRTVLMFLLGWIYSGILRFKPFDEFRVWGVLQRLALGYGFAAVVVVFFRIRGQIVAAAACLVGYYLAMRFIPVPGEHGGPWSPEGNLANYIDRALFAPRQLYEKYGDPEGPFSTIPAVATALMGAITGQWLRTTRTPHAKLAGMVGAGVMAIAAGYLWSLDMPVIKKIWTSSYALIAAGWSVLLLSLFYWLIDIRGWRRWSFFFVVIGANAITIYILQRFVNFEGIVTSLGLRADKGTWMPVATVAAAIGLKWTVLWVLYRYRVFLRL